MEEPEEESEEEPKEEPVEGPGDGEKEKKAAAKEYPEKEPEKGVQEKDPETVHLEICTVHYIIFCVRINIPYQYSSEPRGNENLSFELWRKLS